MAWLISQTGKDRMFQKIEMSNWDLRFVLGKFMEVTCQGF
jgi:hypothetical protein